MEVALKLVDAHCHFDFPRFEGRRVSELEAASQAGVVGLVIPGVRRPDWERVCNTALAYSGLFYCLGIHPWFVAEHSTEDLDALEQLLSRQPDCCIAVGECGLDRLHGELTAQRPWFEAQIELASKLDYPLVIHSVRAHDEVHATLRRRNWCFIGVGGVITHPRARKTRETVARLPLESLVLETDAPDMAPLGVAAGDNSPVYLRQILECLAEIRGEQPEYLASALFSNTEALYGAALWQ